MQNGKPAASHILMRACSSRERWFKNIVNSWHSTTNKMVTSYHINDKNKSNYNDDDDDDKSNSNNNL